MPPSTDSVLLLLLASVPSSSFIVNTSLVSIGVSVNNGGPENDMLIPHLVAASLVHSFIMWRKEIYSRLLYTLFNPAVHPPCFLLSRMVGIISTVSISNKMVRRLQTSNGRIRYARESILHSPMSALAAQRLLGSGLTRSKSHELFSDSKKNFFLEESSSVARDVVR